MLTLSIALLLSADPAPALRLVGDPPTAVEATGLSGKPADPATALTVVVADGTDAQIAARPALLGTATFRDGVLRFEPRFPLAPGVRYRATLSGGGKPLTLDFTVPKPKTEPAAVTAVYPSADRLPDNTLRLYVHFSKPMARGEVYKYVRVVNETDKKDVPMPFLELDDGLWTPDQTRFTLIIDPGRIKREVKPREDLGPVLEAGKKFALVIAKDWPDADGNPLKAEFRKAFTAAPSDRTPIDPAKWVIDPPKGAGPVTVTLEKPLDRALLQRMVWLTGPDGKKIETAGEVTGGERTLRFPLAGKAWVPGRYALVIDTRLEDVCGNRVGEPFEVDVFKPVGRAITVETVTRTFEIK